MSIHGNPGGKSTLFPRRRLHFSFPRRKNTQFPRRMSIHGNPDGKSSLFPRRQNFCTSLRRKQPITAQTSLTNSTLRRKQPITAQTSTSNKTLCRNQPKIAHSQHHHAHPNRKQRLFPAHPSPTSQSLLYGIASINKKG